MDHSFSRVRGRRASRADDKSSSATRGLCDRGHPDEHSDAAWYRMGDLAPSEAEERERDRQLLVQLFTPVDSRAAGGWATQLVKEFGTIGSIFAASTEARTRLTSDRRPAELLNAVHETAIHMLRLRASDQPVISSLSAVINYLMAVQGHQRIETLRTLYLDTQNRLLKDELVTPGLLDCAQLHMREVIKRALELDAASIILAHNHPSGDPAPSEKDVEVTRMLGWLANSVGLVLHDHLIIAAGGWYSFREQGLLS